jgi:co-chaperonin GroES (HSP10)
MNASDFKETVEWLQEHRHFLNPAVHQGFDACVDQLTRYTAVLTEQEAEPGIRVTELKQALSQHHVIWLDAGDPRTVVDADSPGYRTPGWYCTDESSMLESGPYANCVDAVFHAGKYCERLGSGAISAAPREPVKCGDFPGIPGTPATEPVASTQPAPQERRDPWERSLQAMLLRSHEVPPHGLRVGPRRILIRADEHRTAGTIVALGRDVECSKYPGPTDPLLMPHPGRPLFRVGNRVLIGSYAGTDVTISGVDYIVAKVDDVLVVVEEGTSATLKGPQDFKTPLSAKQYPHDGDAESETGPLAPPAAPLTNRAL